MSELKDEKIKELTQSLELQLRIARDEAILRNDMFHEKERWKFEARRLESKEFTCEAGHATKKIFWSCSECVKLEKNSLNEEIEELKEVIRSFKIALGESDDMQDGGKK